MESLRRLAKWIGAALSLIALAVFIGALAKLLSAREAIEMIRWHWGTVLLALGFYAAAYLPMTLAWVSLARGCGAEVETRLLARVFLVSQIGKYLPGNVAQFLGRAYLARQLGIPLALSGLAMMLELAGVLTAGSILAGLAALFGVGEGGGEVLPFIAGVMAITASAAALFILRRKIGALGKLGKPFLVAFGLYLAVFALLGGSNIVLMGSVSGDWSAASLWRVAGALMVSWLIGFVTPGAPAGLGLRELSFFSLLSGVYPQSAILFAAVGFRLVTLAGDGLAWLVGMLLRSPQHHAEPTPA